MLADRRPSWELFQEICPLLKKDSEELLEDLDWDVAWPEEKPVFIHGSAIREDMMIRDVEEETRETQERKTEKDLQETHVSPKKGKKKKVLFAEPDLSKGKRISKKEEKKSSKPSKQRKAVQQEIKVDKKEGKIAKEERGMGQEVEEVAKLKEKVVEQERRPLKDEIKLSWQEWKKSWDQWKNAFGETRISWDEWKETWESQSHQEEEQLLHPCREQGLYRLRYKKEYPPQPLHRFGKELYQNILFQKAYLKQPTQRRRHRYRHPYLHQRGRFFQYGYEYPCLFLYLHIQKTFQRIYIQYYFYL